MGGAVKGIANVVGAVGSVIPGSVSGAMANDITGKRKANPDEIVNPVDPRLAAIRDKQIQQAQDYRANIQGEREKQYNLAQEGSRRGLAESIANVNKEANARGLLYGAKRQGMEAEARAQNAGALNTQIKGINDQTEAQANALENQALGSGMAVNSMEQNRQDQIYNLALQRQREKAGAFGSMLGGMGGGLGLLSKGK